jgi:hypothetical protein
MAVPAAPTQAVTAVMYSNMLLPELGAGAGAGPVAVRVPLPGVQLASVQVPATVVCTSAWSIAIAAKTTVARARQMKTTTRRRLLLVAMVLTAPLRGA